MNGQAKRDLVKRDPGGNLGCSASEMAAVLRQFPVHMQRAPKSPQKYTAHTCLLVDEERTTVARKKHIGSNIQVGNAFRASNLAEAGLVARLHPSGCSPNASGCVRVRRPLQPWVPWLS